MPHYPTLEKIPPKRIPLRHALEKVSPKRMPLRLALEKIPLKRIPLYISLEKISPKRILLRIPLEKMFAKKRLRLSDLKKMDQERIHGRRMNPILATNGLGDEAPIHAPTKEGIQAGVEQGVLGRGEIRVGVENA